MTIPSSCIAFVVAALVAATNLVPVLADGSALYELWQIEDVPTYSFVAETSTFTITFGVNNAITATNVVGTMWEEGCMEGGNPLAAADGILGFATAVDTPGEATITFQLDPETLSQNEDVFTDLPAQAKAQMKFCSRFALQTDDASWKVNFLEVIITVFFDLTAGFVVEAFAVEPVEREEDTGDKDYAVDAYLCDPAFPDVPLLDLTFPQGSLITVCVTPTVVSQADGIAMEKIESFQWVRGFMEQPAIANALPSANQLTNYVCVPGSIVCSFTSILYADFFTPLLKETLAPSQAPTEQVTICEGVDATPDTNLNFYGSTVKRSTLQAGGELRYGDIGTVDGQPVDILITSTDYYHPNANANGLDSTGNFGDIAVRVVEGEPDSGKGTLDFCLVEEDTYTPVTASSFQWAAYDIDNRNGSPNNVHEKISMDTSQVAGYSFYPDMAGTEVNIYCESDGSPPPCGSGVRTVFEGAVTGNGLDNPTDPNALTETQKKRSVVFTFTDTSCFTFEFHSYCPTEPGTPCAIYGGAKFLFGGGAPQVVTEGDTECSDGTRRKLDGLEPEGWTTIRTAESSSDSSSNNSTDADVAFPSVRASSDTDRRTQVTWISPEVVGEGVAILRFDTTRRRLDNTDTKTNDYHNHLKGGRGLQTTADGPAATIGLTVDLSLTTDAVGSLRTAGGSSRWSTNHCALRCFVSGLAFFVSAVVWT